MAGVTALQSNNLALREFHKPVEANCQLIISRAQDEQYALFVMFGFGPYRKMADGSKYCILLHGKNYEKFCTGDQLPKSPHQGQKKVYFRYEDDLGLIDMTFHWEDSRGVTTQITSERASMMIRFLVAIAGDCFKILKSL